MSFREEKMRQLNISIENVEVLDELQTTQIEELILEKIVFIPSGRIDWRTYPNSILVLDLKETIKEITNRNCYVMWDEGTLPIVKTNLDSIGNNIFEITKIAFDTWVVGDRFDWVIEFHHTGLIHYTTL
jgi:hypothetical protein